MVNQFRRMNWQKQKFELVAANTQSAYPLYWRMLLSAVSTMFHRLKLFAIWPGNGQQKGGIL